MRNTYSYCSSTGTGQTKLSAHPPLARHVTLGCGDTSWFGCKAYMHRVCLPAALPTLPSLVRHHMIAACIYTVHIHARGQTIASCTRPSHSPKRIHVRAKTTQNTNSSMLWRRNIATHCYVSSQLDAAHVLPRKHRCQHGRGRNVDTPWGRSKPRKERFNTTWSPSSSSSGRAGILERILVLGQNSPDSCSATRLWTCRWASRSGSRVTARATAWPIRRGYCRMSRRCFPRKTAGFHPSRRQWS